MDEKKKRVRKKARNSTKNVLLLDSPRKSTKKNQAGKRRTGAKKGSSIKTKRSVKQTNNTIKQKRRPKRKKQVKLILLQLGFSLLLTLGLVYLVSLFTFTIQRMEGYMMMPTIADGETLFVNKLQTIRRFDLVLIKDEENGSLSVRRVIGLPSERISYKNDELFVNDTYQVERFLEKKLYESHQMGMILTKDFTLSQVTGETVIPKEEYFVLGDNRAYAQDSRGYGTVRKSQIIGVIKMRLFPFHKMSGL